MIDPATALAIFELIETSIKVGSKLSDLIRRAKSGEAIPIEEIKADRAELDSLVDDWDEACGGDE